MQSQPQTSLVASRRKRRLSTALILLLLVGCGQKGPLYLSDSKKKTKVPATQPQSGQSGTPQPTQPPQPPPTSTPLPLGTP